MLCVSKYLEKYLFWICVEKGEECNLKIKSKCIFKV